MLRRPLISLVVAALLVAACGSDETSTSTSDRPGCPSAKVLDAVKLTTKKGEQPKLTFDKPLTVETTSCKVVREGTGDVLTDGSTAVFNYVFLNGRDGSEISSSYGQEPAEVLFDDELMAGVHVALDGAAVGSQILVAITPADGFGAEEDDPQTGVKADDILLFFVDLLDVRSPLAKATGKAVEPVPGLPTVEVAKDGTPSITVPKADPPSELVSQLLIEGKGAVVESGQSITVHYTGVLWSTGEVFDSSWSTGKPVSFPIGTGGVIPGWDKGLVDHKIGSRVLLVIPPADGYPEGQGSIPAGATLVFVVDILDAH